MQARVGAGRSELGERCQPGDRGHRVSVERSHLGHEVGGPLEAGVQAPHDRRPATNRAQREPAADNLPVGRQVGNNPVILLGAPVGEAEASNHLIEDQRELVALSQRSETVEKPFLGRDDSLERLDDDCGELIS